MLQPSITYLRPEVQEFEDEKTQVDFRFDRIFLKYYFLVKSQVVSFSCWLKSKWKQVKNSIWKKTCQIENQLEFFHPWIPGPLIPDYFKIIKTRMGLYTIKKKLDEGTYTEPWEFVDDVWQMFENAWTYNRKQSRVYKYCSKVNTST